MAISFIVPLVVIVVVALLILAVSGIRNESKEGGKDVIKNVYLYLVLFATLMMTIGGSVGTFMALADIIAPAPYHQSFEEYKRFGMEKPYPDTNPAEEAKLSEEELKQRYETMRLEQKSMQTDRAKNNLIKSFGWIIVPLPVFLYFQRRLARKEQD